MCCMVPFKRYIFAVQTSMQRKVEFKKKNYIGCNQIKKLASYDQKTKFKKQKTLKQ